jgi:DmsE family decaheme c-type cytochrome
MRTRPILSMQHGFLLGGVLGILALFGTTPAAAQRPAQPAAMAPGSEQTCLKCHGGDAKVMAILKSPMAVKGDPRTPFAMGGCQSCHGDSADHIAMKKAFPDIVFSGPNASPVAARNEVCLSCHQGGLRMNWQGSPHEVNNKACTDCHTAHAAKDPVLVKLGQPEKCFTCHARQRAESFEYSHHPVREGLVSCSDCHNPHGSAGDTKQLKEFSVNETCYNCHAEKRGPLLWEHQPVRENCTNCHTPHGSNEPRLMKERMTFLCDGCHSAAANHSGGAFGGARSIPFRGPGNPSINSALANQRTCTNCHVQIHGSNSPAGAYFFR